MVGSLTVTIRGSRLGPLRKIRLVETNIDIRNERMLEHVFKGLATATLNASIDMAEAEALAIGESTVLDVEGTLSLVGTDVEIETEMFVVRLTDTKVMATTGPSLYNILGASAGQVEGFRYSKAMAESDLIWDAETMGAFLADPKKIVKGTKMAFRGLKKPEDIENVIAYLAEQKG